MIPLLGGFYFSENILSDVHTRKCLVLRFWEVVPFPKKKSKHIGWMLDNDYSEGDGKEGEDCNAARGRVAPGGGDGDDSDDSDDNSDDDFVTPKRRNKKLAKRATKNWPNVSRAKKGKQQSTLI